MSTRETLKREAVLTARTLLKCVAAGLLAYIASELLRATA